MHDIHDDSICVTPSVMDYLVRTGVLLIGLFVLAPISHYYADPMELYGVLGYFVAHGFLFLCVDFFHPILQNRLLQYQVVVTSTGISKEFFDGETISGQWDQLTRLVYKHHNYNGEDYHHVLFIFDDESRLRLPVDYPSTNKILAAVLRLAGHYEAVKLGLINWPGSIRADFSFDDDE